MPKFVLLGDTQVFDLIKGSKLIKSCALDPLPAHSCGSVTLPWCLFWKELLNNTCSWWDTWWVKNCYAPTFVEEGRSVSNLTFVSKLILKAVFNKLNGYNLTDNDLHVTFKSAYKVFHSTETSLLKVHNDIVLALDKGRTCWWFCLQQKSNTKTYGDRAFSTCAPRLWNNIPLDILRSNSVSTF